MSKKKSGRANGPRKRTARKRLPHRKSHAKKSDKGTRGSKVEMLFRQFEKTHTFATDAATGQVYVFEQTHWVPWNDLKLRHYAEVTAEAVLTKTFTTEFADRVKRHYLRDAYFGNTVPWRLNLQNGVLNLRERDLESHNSTHGFTCTLDYSYDKRAKCPAFDKFLDQVTMHDPKLRLMLLEWMGYVITGDDLWAQKFLLLFGTGENGKSTLLAVMASMIEPYVRFVPLASLLGNRFARAALKGALLNVSDETPKDALLVSDSFKNLVSESEIEIEEKFKPLETIRHRVKFVIAGNDTPRLEDTSKGMLRRMLVAPFDYQIPQGEKDESLEQKLLRERSGILNRILDAYSQAKSRACFTESRRSARLLASIIRESCPVAYWFREWIELFPVNDTSFIPLADLHDHFCSKERADDREPMNKDAFSKRLSKLMPERVGFSGPRDSRTRGYKGVCIRAEVHECTGNSDSYEGMKK